MKKKRLIKDPNSPEAVEAAIERIGKMNPEEALAFLMYRTPGVPETDMVGMFSKQPEQKREERKRVPG